MRNCDPGRCRPTRRSRAIDRVVACCESWQGSSAYYPCPRRMSLRAWTWGKVATANGLSEFGRLARRASAGTDPRTADMGRRSMQCRNLLSAKAADARARMWALMHEEVFPAGSYWVKVDKGQTDPHARSGPRLSMIVVPRDVPDARIERHLPIFDYQDTHGPPTRLLEHRGNRHRHPRRQRPLPSRSKLYERGKADSDSVVA